MKNLKDNPVLLMQLRRKAAILNFISELAFNAEVHELSYELNDRKSSFTISCNGIVKVFKIDTPLVNIKKEVSKCLNVKRVVDTAPLPPPQKEVGEDVFPSMDEYKEFPPVEGQTGC